jgi:hypothetical protein
LEHVSLIAVGSILDDSDIPARLQTLVVSSQLPLGRRRPQPLLSQFQISRMMTPLYQMVRTCRGEPLRRRAGRARLLRLRVRVRAPAGRGQGVAPPAAIRVRGSGSACGSGRAPPAVHRQGAAPPAARAAQGLLQRVGRTTAPPAALTGQGLRQSVRLKGEPFRRRAGAGRGWAMAHRGRRQHPATAERLPIPPSPSIFPSPRGRSSQGTAILSGKCRDSGSGASVSLGSGGGPTLLPSYDTTWRERVPVHVARLEWWRHRPSSCWRRRLSQW